MAHAGNVIRPENINFSMMQEHSIDMTGSEASNTIDTNLSKVSSTINQVVGS